MKIAYWIVKIIFSLMVISAAFAYVFTHAEVAANFTALGFPVFLIYPMAVTKTLGVIGIWQNKSRMLKEWAYAGLTFNFLLAFGAHINVNDGEWFGPIIALVLLIATYQLEKRKA